MNNHEQATAQPPARPTWAVAWEIDVDPDSASNAYEAALRVWRETFGRTGKPGPEEACVFTVTDPAGRTWQVDLYLPPEEAQLIEPGTSLQLDKVRTVEVQLPNGREKFAFPLGVKASTDATETTLIVSGAVIPTEES